MKKSRVTLIADEEFVVEVIIKFSSDDNIEYNFEKLSSRTSVVNYKQIMIIIII